MSRIRPGKPENKLMADWQERMGNLDAARVEDVFPDKVEQLSVERLLIRGGHLIPLQADGTPEEDGLQPYQRKWERGKLYQPQW